jgi:hypothetical protein
LQTRAPEAFAPGAPRVFAGVGPSPSLPFPPKPVAANRRTAFCILGIMGFMAGVGLIYALATQSYRRQHVPFMFEAPPLL